MTFSGTIVSVQELAVNEYPEADGGRYVVAVWQESHTPTMGHGEAIAYIGAELDPGQMLAINVDGQRVSILLEHLDAPEAPGLMLAQSR